MNQRKLDEREEEKNKAEGKYEGAFAKTDKTFAGFDYDFSEKKTFDDSPEEREKFFHKLLIEEGGFRFWLKPIKICCLTERPMTRLTITGVRWSSSAFPIPRRLHCSHPRSHHTHGAPRDLRSNKIL